MVSVNLLLFLVVDEHVKPEFSARNLEELFDTYLSLNGHVTKLYKAAQIQLRSISKIIKFISLDSAEILIHAFVS